MECMVGCHGRTLVQKLLRQIAVHDTRLCLPVCMTACLCVDWCGGECED